MSRLMRIIGLFAVIAVIGIIVYSIKDSKDNRTLRTTMTDKGEAFCQQFSLNFSVINNEGYCDDGINIAKVLYTDTGWRRLLTP